MKQIKKTALIFLVAALLITTLFSGCAGVKTVYTDAALKQSAEAAAKDRVKTEISNNYKTFKIAKEKDDLIIESVTNEGLDWFANGTVTVVSKGDASNVQTVDFSIELELIDYVGQPTPTFKLIKFDMGKIEVPEN